MKRIAVIATVSGLISLLGCKTSIDGLTCSDDGDCTQGGVCKQGVCEQSFFIISPVNGDKVVGASVQVTARLGGKVLPPQVQLKAEHKGSQDTAETTLSLVPGTNEYQGTVPLAHDGQYSLLAYQENPVGESLPVSITVDGCASSCTSKSECLNGVCTPLLTLMLAPPLEVKSQPGKYAVKATVAQTPGTVGDYTKVVPPDAITVEIAAVNTNNCTEDVPSMLLFRQANGEYSDSYQPTVAGLHSAVAKGEEIGTSNTAQFTVIPVLTVAAPDCSSLVHPIDASKNTSIAGACRRDQQIKVRIESNVTNVEAGLVEVLAKDAQQVASGFSTAPVSCTKRACLESAVDLWKPNLQAMNGEFKITAVVYKDETKKEVVFTSNETSVSVGRYVWIGDTEANSPINTTPAIGKAGDVYLTTQDSLTNQNQFFYFDKDRELSGKSLERYVPSAIVLNAGSENVVAVAASLGSVSKLFIKRNNEAAFAKCGSSGPDFGLGMALGLVNPGDDAAVVTGMVNDNANKAMAMTFALNSAKTVTCVSMPSTGTFTLNSSQPGPIGIKSADAKNTLFVGDDKKNLQQVTFEGSSAAASPVSLAGALTSVIPGDGTNLAGTVSLPDAGVNGLFVGTNNGAAIARGIGGSANGVVEDSQGWFYAGGISGNNTAFWGYQPSTSATRGPWMLDGQMVGSPAIGRPISTDVPAKIYAVTVKDGASILYVIDSVSGPIWHETMPFEVSASLSLDCNHAPTVNTGTGVAYFGTKDGKVVTLIIDDSGLDNNAKWPKDRHDPQNTGNAGYEWPRIDCH